MSCTTGLASDTAVNREWLPATVTQDPRLTQAPALNAIEPSARAADPGGLQIAGPSIDVFVLRTKSTGGTQRHHAGRVAIVDNNGRPTREVTGVTIEVPALRHDDHLTIPGSTTGGQDGGTAIPSASP